MKQPNNALQLPKTQESHQIRLTSFVQAQYFTIDPCNKYRYESIFRSLKRRNTLRNNEAKLKC